MEVILFSGVHGVGKGFFLKKIKTYIENYNVYSASGLIEKVHSSTDAGYKRVSDVKNNQDILIEAIKREKIHTEKMILDGHLCILNATGKIERIPESFFVDVQITGIVILQDKPEVICDRMVQRDAQKLDIDVIRNMQKEEYDYAQELQDRLQIPYIVISPEFTVEQFMEKFRKVGGN